jgi:hypothetical protein
MNNITLINTAKKEVISLIEENNFREATYLVVLLELLKMKMEENK